MLIAGTGPESFDQPRNKLGHTGMIARIAHTTDFSRESNVAFAHALGLALVTRSRLDILHVRTQAEEHAWESFPHVREILAKWGLLDASAAPADIETKLGVRVAKIDIDHRDALGGIGNFLLNHRPDLIVVATHGRHGINRWLQGSVSEFLAERTHVPTLLIGPNVRGFVDAQTGQLALRRILFPVASTPSPDAALKLLTAMLPPFGVTRDGIAAIHIGTAVAEIRDRNGETLAVDRMQGPVVETIARAASERDADLIAMATAGHRGFLDAFRGSTTSRVVAQAPCPVLALPLTKA